MKLVLFITLFFLTKLTYANNCNRIKRALKKAQDRFENVRIENKKIKVLKKEYNETMARLNILQSVKKLKAEYTSTFNFFKDQGNAENFFDTLQATKLIGLSQTLTYLVHGSGLGRESGVRDAGRNRWWQFIGIRGSIDVTERLRNNCTATLANSRANTAAKAFCQALNDDEKQAEIVQLINDFRSVMRIAYRNPSGASDAMQRLLQSIDNTIDESMLSLNRITRAKVLRYNNLPGRAMRSIFSNLNLRRRNLNANQFANPQDKFKFEREFLMNKCSDFNQALYYEYANEPSSRNLIRLQNSAIPRREMMIKFRDLAKRYLSEVESCSDFRDCIQKYDEDKINTKITELTTKSTELLSKINSTSTEPHRLVMSTLLKAFKSEECAEEDGIISIGCEEGTFRASLIDRMKPILHEIDIDLENDDYNPEDLRNACYGDEKFISESTCTAIGVRPPPPRQPREKRQRPRRSARNPYEQMFANYLYPSNNMIPGMYHTQSAYGALYGTELSPYLQQTCNQSLFQMQQFPLPIQQSFFGFYPQMNDFTSYHCFQM